MGLRKAIRELTMEEWKMFDVINYFIMIFILSTFWPYNFNVIFHYYVFFFLWLKSGLVQEESSNTFDVLNNEMLTISTRMVWEDISIYFKMTYYLIFFAHFLCGGKAIEFEELRQIRQGVFKTLWDFCF